MIEKLECEIRTALGTRAARRLRRSERVPVNLYGHGQPPVNLHASAETVEHLVQQGVHLVQLEGAVEETAFVREVQWDTYGIHVLHLDLVRVAAGEKVEVTLAVELRGEAPAVKEGGTVEHHGHEITIRCPAASVPEKLLVSINDLHLGQSILAKDLALPEGAVLLSDPEEVIVASHAKVEIEEEEGPAPADLSAEPEVIGRKSQEDEEAETASES